MSRDVPIGGKTMAIADPSSALGEAAAHRRPAQVASNGVGPRCRDRIRSLADDGVATQLPDRTTGSDRADGARKMDETWAIRRARSRGPRTSR